jgi:hypothetical protein
LKSSEAIARRLFIWVSLVAIATRCAPHGLSSEVRAGGSAPVAPVGSADPLVPLRTFENTRRAQTDFAHMRTSDTALGPDPYVIRAVPAVGGPPGSRGFVGVLRGRSVLVELDGSLHEVARLPAPQSTTGLAIGSRGDVFAVGELSSRVARYRRSQADGRLEATGAVLLPGVIAMRDVAIGPEGVLYVVEEHDGRLLALIPRPAAGEALPEVRVDSPICHGPLHVMRVARSVLVDCLLDHAIVIRAVDAHGLPTTEGQVRIVHDGPMWGMDAFEEDGALLLAVGGVEDHPLDRTEGSFGFVDSFVTLYRVAAGSVAKLSEVNVSARGVVTPKALSLSRNPRGTLQLAVAGYGSNRLAILDWGSDAMGQSGLGKDSLEGGRALREPSVSAIEIPPGSAMMARLSERSFVLANPLLDTWVRAAPDGTVVVPVEDDTSRARAKDSRLGEALFFTTLMAPWNKAEGRLSRFTCETCHFEGYVDGRTHHTGRGNVLATTKPLLGLFNNRPHFSRALDPDLTTMVNNEFRVAGAKSGHDPWFSLSPADVPWAKDFFAPSEALGPEALRRALMTFLMDFTHRSNPAVAGRASWTAREREGAVLFRDKCESCHEARLVADQAPTRVPFERWEGLVMSPEGPLVWAHAEYEKTGILPYVNEKGARVVSLRRLYKKHPYFTNGSAHDLHDVLDRVRFAGNLFFHDGAPQGATALNEEEQAALAAFLDLL